MQYGARVEILQGIVRRTGKTFETMTAGKGVLRHRTMAMPYRPGGMTYPEVGRLSGADCSAVSQERRSVLGRSVGDVDVLSTV